MDNIMIRVYSDFWKENFVCGTFQVNTIDFVNFADLEVPCDKEIIVTLIDRDSQDQDFMNVRIQCDK